MEHLNLTWHLTSSWKSKSSIKYHSALLTAHDVNGEEHGSESMISNSSRSRIESTESHESSDGLMAFGKPSPPCSASYQANIPHDFLVQGRVK